MRLRGEFCPPYNLGEAERAEDGMAGAGWTMRGEYMESCNCDYLCPCIYTNPQGPATHDNCTAIMAFRIDEGSAGLRGQLTLMTPVKEKDARFPTGCCDEGTAVTIDDMAVQGRGWSA